MPGVGFEPMTPVFERAKTVNALDCAATVTGNLDLAPNVKMLYNTRSLISTVHHAYVRTCAFILFAHLFACNVMSYVETMFMNRL
jgi:hypothetical protein